MITKYLPAHFASYTWRHTLLAVITIISLGYVFFSAANWLGVSLKWSVSLALLMAFTMAHTFYREIQPLTATNSGPNTDLGYNFRILPSFGLFFLLMDAGTKFLVPFVNGAGAVPTRLESWAISLVALAALFLFRRYYLSRFVWVESKAPSTSASPAT